MSLFEGVRRVLRLGAWRPELDEELAFHFDQTVEELQEGGLSLAAAREEARRRFGDERRWRRELESLDRRTEALRRWRGWSDALRQTLRQTFRRLRRSPGFAIGVIVVFALGIGANATMFSIIDRILLSPPAHVEDADQVRRILLEQREQHTGIPVPVETISYAEYTAAAGSSGFSSVAGVAGGAAMLDSGDGLRMVPAERVTGSLFPLLGVRPHLGRFFTPAEDAVGQPPLVVLSHQMWQQEFGGDPAVLGQILDFDFGAAEVVGVAPPGFTGMDLRAIDLWLPLHAVAGASGNTYCIDTSSCNWIRLVGRLAPDADPANVQAEMTTRLRQERAEDIERERLAPDARLLLTPLVAGRGPLASDESQVAIWLGGISLIVLLVACANIANLLLARATRQEREVGVRLALGSSRRRIIGQALTESLLLALAGALLAVVITRWSGAALRTLLLPGIAWEAPGLEMRTALATGMLALAAGLAAGILPALQTRRADVAEILKGGGRGSSAPRGRMRGALTVAQAALSVILLIGAGLFVRSLHRVNQMDLGIEPRGVIVATPCFGDGLTAARRAELITQARDRVAALPAVEAVSLSRSSPFVGATGMRVNPQGADHDITIPELPTVHYIDSEYLRLMRLDLLRGRDVLESDDERAPPVALVNETMASAFWPRAEALGQCIEVGRNPNDPGEALPCVRVVGVVENARRFRLIEEESMQFYLPASQGSNPPGALLVRVREGANDPTSAIETALRTLDQTVRYAHLQPLQEMVDAQARSWTLGATLFSAFGLLAMVVASIGLYSVLAFQVTQRAFELGVRSALGAHPLRLAALILNHAILIVGGGVVAGLGIAWIAAPAVAKLLHETSPQDPAVYLSVAAVLLGISVVAAIGPALRATRADPAVALRAE